MSRLRDFGRGRFSPANSIRSPFWCCLIFSGIVLADYFATGRMSGAFIIFVTFLPGVFSTVADRMGRLQRQNEVLEARITELQAQGAVSPEVASSAT